MSNCSSDYENLKVMLSRLVNDGIMNQDCIVEDNETYYVQCPDGEKKVRGTYVGVQRGYAGFICAFNFDDKGNLIDIGAFE